MRRGRSSTAAGGGGALGEAGGSSEGGSSLKLLLSNDGELVRDILLDEVAKVCRGSVTGWNGVKRVISG